MARDEYCSDYSVHMEGSIEGTASSIPWTMPFVLESSSDSDREPQAVVSTKSTSGASSKRILAQPGQFHGLKMCDPCKIFSAVRHRYCKIPQPEV